MPTEIDYAYLAGIVDGEGTITLTRNNAKDKFRRPTLSVSNTDVGLMNWLQAEFGGKIKTIVSQRYLTSYEWRVEFRVALELLRMIRPSLKVRQKQLRADHILTHYQKVTLRNGHYTAVGLERKQAFEEAFFMMGAK